jgi:hypothetical protein
MNSVYLLTLIVIGVKSQDPCQRLHPSSFCLTSGMCSPPLTVSCNEAYIQTGEGLLILMDSTPQFIQLTPRQLLAARAMADSRRDGSSRDLPPTISAHPDYIDLLRLMDKLSNHMTAQFPTISAPIEILTQLVAAAEKVASDIVNPILQRKEKRTFTLFGSDFYASRSVQIIAYIIRMSARYIASSDLSIRSSLLGNWIPIFHACSRVNQILSIPDLLARPSFVEILTEAVKFDPIYEASPPEKLWNVSLYNHRRDLVLPLLPPTDIDDFPLVVMDMLFLDLSPPSSGKIDSIIQQLVIAIRSRFHDKLNVVRAALFYMSNFPGITDLDRTYFCSQSKDLWNPLMSSFTASETEIDSNNAISLIDLLRICGKTFLSIEDRVRLILPIVLAGSRDSKLHEICVADQHGNTNILTTIESFSRVTFLHLRRKVLLKKDKLAPATEMEHARLLGEFVSEMLEKAFRRFVRVHNTVSSFRERATGFTNLPMTVLGQTIALLVISGDPDHVLQKLLTDGTMPNLYMNSYHVRNGFCVVVDCNVFDTLFTDNELPTVIELLRTNQHILNPSGEMILVS